MNQHDLLIIGGGMAGLMLIEALRGRGDRRSIGLVGAEDPLPYNRVLLSPMLAGECDWADVVSHDEDWYTDHQVHLYLGRRVESIDHQHHRLHCDSGELLTYRQLVIATGARASRPRLPGSQASGVHNFRDLADLQRLSNLPAGSRIVVVGAGLLGIEAATGLAARGVHVTLLHRHATLMNRQLDTTAAELLDSSLCERGIEVRTGVAPAVLATRRGQVSGVVLEDGHYLPADGVVFATGIEPEITLAHRAGLAVGRGIQVDEGLATSVPDIFALGECCERNGRTVGLLEPIREHARVLAARLCDEPDRCEETPFITRLKVSGLAVHSLGEQPEDAESLTLLDRHLRHYRRLWIRDNRLIGALLVGSVGDSSHYLQLLRANTDLSDLRIQLLFQPDPHSHSLSSPHAGAQPLSAAANPTQPRTTVSRAA